MRGPGAYLVLFGLNVAEPPLLRDYPVWSGSIDTLRDAAIEQCRRALALCRLCRVPIPEQPDASRPA